MKLRHWAGYGTLEVKRIARRKPWEAKGCKYIHRFLIKGEHERGHLPYYEDSYTVEKWLSRFLKNERVVNYWEDRYLGNDGETYLYVITEAKR